MTNIIVRAVNSVDLPTLTIAEEHQHSSIQARAILADLDFLKVIKTAPSKIIVT